MICILTTVVEYMFFLLQPGQIIDIRAMLNDATRLNVEEGSNNFTNVGDVSSISSCIKRLIGKAKNKAKFLHVSSIMAVSTRYTYIHIPLLI